MDSFGYSKWSRPAICSGDKPFFSLATTYRRTKPFFSRSFLPRFFRLARARSWAHRGRYETLSPPVRPISPETEEEFRCNVLAMVLIEDFCQNISCIFSRSSIEKCLNFIHFDYLKVLQLLVELTQRVCNPRKKKCLRRENFR